MNFKLLFWTLSALIFGQLSLGVPTKSDYLFDTIHEAGFTTVAHTTFPKEKKGYTLSYSGGRYEVRTESYDDGDDPVDIIGIDTSNKVITVYAAYNGWEERDESERYKLRDIQMELWDIQPDVRRADLAAIRRKGIVNKQTSKQIRKVYNTLGREEDETVVLNSADTGTAAIAWSQLEDTPFFGGTEKLLDEYDVGKRIVQVIISPTDQISGDHDLEFRFS